MSPDRDGTLSFLEYHVLLALADGPLYGYAVRDAVENESDGALSPRAGSLYRVIARMMTSGHVVETDAPEGEDPHPGRERRYYELTAGGRAALSEAAERLKLSALLAERRLEARP